MIWKKEFSQDAFEQWSQNTLVGNLGIEIIGTENNTLVGRMPVDHRTRQFMGILHGGASAAFTETLGSIAGFLTLEENSGKTIVGTEIQASHLRSVTSGFVTGIANPIKLGVNIQVWAIEIFNDDQQLICHAKLHCMVRDIKQTTKKI